MGKEIFKDRKLLELVDGGMCPAAAAKELGVSRQAVHKRLRELRGRTTRAVIAKKVRDVVNQRIDAIGQLLAINERANAMLDEAEDNPELRLKVMAEIRGQLRLQLEIYQALFDLQAVQEFMDEIMGVIAQVAPEVRNEIIRRLNERKSIRSALRFA
jgi:predicted transcriptional regulator